MKLPWRRTDWPERAKEDFEERAAIVEFDAGLSRAEANTQADAMVRRQWEGEEQLSWEWQ